MLVVISALVEMVKLKGGSSTAEAFQHFQPQSWILFQTVLCTCTSEG